MSRSAFRLALHSGAVDALLLMAHPCRSAWGVSLPWAAASAALPWAGMWLPFQGARTANQRVSLDGAGAFWFHFPAHCRRASEPERSLKPCASH